MIPTEPLAQSTPRFTGWLRLPSMERIAPPFRCTSMPRRRAHMQHVVYFTWSPIGGEVSIGREDMASSA